MSGYLLAIHEARVRRFDPATGVATVVMPGPYGMEPIEAAPFVSSQIVPTDIPALVVGDRVLVTMNENEPPEWISVNADWLNQGDDRYVNITGDMMTGSLDFQTVPLSQRINLYGNPSNFGIGVQASTHYARTTASSAGAFAWFSGGVHSDTQYDPGAGGYEMMRLAGGSNVAKTLSIPGRLGSNFLLGDSVSSGPRLRMHLPASSEICYIDFEGTTAGAGDLYFRSGIQTIVAMESGLVSLNKPVNVTGQTKMAGGVQSLILTDGGNGPYVGLYDGLSAVSVGSRKGYMGFVNATGLLITNEVSAGYIRLHAVSASGYIDFYTANVYQGRFTAAGDFLVAKTSVDTTTVGCAVTGGGRFYATTANTVHYNYISNIIAAEDNDIHIHFRRSDATVGSVNMTTALTGVDYSTSCDMTHKGNEQEIDDEAALAIIERLHPRAYQWRYDDDGEPSPEGTPQGEFEYGFFAQELFEVLPRTVTPGKGTWAGHKKWRADKKEYVRARKEHEEWEEKNADKESKAPKRPPPDVPDDPGEVSPYEPWMMDHSKVVPYLAAAMQALIRQVRTQAAEIVELRAMLPGSSA